MRSVTAIFVFLALFASLGPFAQPLQSARPQSMGSRCCATMQERQNDCAKHMPKSKQDQQCCATCVLTLDLFIGGRIPLPAPSSADECFALYPLNERFRSDRPPTPPPRLAAA